MKVDMDLQGVDGVLATLKSLPHEVVSKRGGPVKLALAKGARELRDEAKKNLRAAIAINGDDSSGLLEKNVIASRGKQAFGVKGERYLVRVKRKSYPGRAGKPVTTLKTANLLEYGSSNQPATPWLRPAVQSKGQKVINTVITDLVKRVDKVVQKLAMQNRGK
ncbi:MAG: HK97 gp10 family phage protein [Pusillimonas sp.]|nr:HK97 gp10 family phage protein [Pusillimonas sp.]